MSRIKLCLRTSAGVLGALVALSPPAGAGGSALMLRDVLRTAARDATPLATGNTHATWQNSGFVTTATTKLDLSKLDAADFGDEAR